MTLPLRYIGVCLIACLLAYSAAAVAETTRTDSVPLSVIKTPGTPIAGTLVSQPISVIKTPGTPRSGALVSQPISVIKSLDTSPPSNLSVVINGGDAFVNTTSVTLTLLATDSGVGGVDKMQFSNDGTTWSDWLDYALTASWTLLGTGDGEKTVYSRFKDAVGNISDPVSDTITVDTAAPDVPSITGYQTPVGKSSVAVSGSKGADIASVVVMLNGQAFTGASVSYPTATTWTVEVTGLAEGENTVTVRGLDGAGNESEPSVVVTVVYDVNPPVWNGLVGARFVDPGDGRAVMRWNGAEDAETGWVSYNVYYSDVSPVDYSTAEKVTVTADDLLTGYYQSDKGYDHQYTLTGLENNKLLYVSVRAADRFGNEDDNNVTVKVVPQSVAGAVVHHLTEDWTGEISGLVVNTEGGLKLAPDANNGSYTSQAINIGADNSASAVAWDQRSDEAAGQSVSVELDSGAGWTAVTDGQQEGLPSGRNVRYRVTMTGDGVNSPVLKSVSIAYNDFMPPAAPAVNAYVTPTNQAVQLISGTKEAGSSVRINGKECVVADASGTWSCAVSLVEGGNTLNITSVEAAGNESAFASPVPVIVLDTIPPAFTVNYVSPSLTTTQTLTGAKEPGCVLKLDGMVIADAADLAATWTYEVTLTNGLLNKLVFTASDALGNTSTKTVNILCDANPPSPLGSGVLEAYGDGDGTTVTLKWTAYNEALVPDLGYYKVFVSGAPITDVAGMAPVKTVNKGAKTAVAAGLALGTTYYFAVVPVDQNGNFVTAVNAVSAAPHDTQSPDEVTNVNATPSFNPAGGSNIIALTWTASVNSRGDLAAQKVYYDDGSGYDAGTDLPGGALTYTRSGVPDNTHVKFKITVLDVSGNESTGRVVEATTRLDNPAPLTAVPGKNKVDLSWGKVVSPYLKNYKVYKLASPQQQTDVASMSLVTTTTAVSSSVTGLTNDEGYQFAVTSVNTSGAENMQFASVAASPRSDATGPAITVFEVKVGSTVVAAGGAVTKAATVNVTASDSESQIAKVELYVDGVLVNSQTGGTLSYSWDVVQTNDGNHQLMVAAYDAPGNKTELTRTYVVSLAPPSAPVIIGHTLVTGNLARVNGTAVAGTQVTLYMGGIPVGGAPAVNGAFQFDQVALSEGDNKLTGKALHRGGESPLSAAYNIVLDTGAPEPPASLIAKTMDAGKAKFTWSAGAGELPVGYNLYYSSSPFASAADAGVSKANSTPVKYQLYEYKPPDDSLRYYAVTSADASGNESGISNVVSVATDRVAPRLSALRYDYIRPDGGVTSQASVAGPGKVEVSFTVSEPLGEPPFFSITPASGSPVVVSLAKQDDTHYKGSFSVNSLTPHGETQYRFTGKDALGNRGDAQGASITFDVKGPVASVTDPASLLKITAEPASFAVAFDEHPVELPSIELLDYSGMPSLIAGLKDTGDGRHYTGTVDLTGMSEGEAEFRLLSAVDGFGNLGDTVSAGRKILLYTDMPPAPPAPEGIMVVSAKGGKVTVSWKAVDGALAYKLYRGMDADGGPALIQSGLTGISTVDVPQADGMYLYSVSAVGQLSSESARSSEVPAVSDRTPPAAPGGQTLSFGADGVTAKWSAPDGEAAASYKLYRSASVITADTIGSLSAVKTGIKALFASDPSPVNSIRNYAVTAVDALGNEGPPSEGADITFPVAPVRDLMLIRLGGDSPVLTWEKPQPEVVGYNIYRDGVKLTPAAVDYTAYTDSYYESGTVRYGISAVDGYGNESPVKEVVFSGFDAGLAPGVTLGRGYLQKVPVMLVNPGDAEVTVDSIDLKVGSTAQSTLTGPFVVGAGSAVQVEKIGATELDAPSMVGVSVLAEWSPSPGVTVMVSTTKTAEVTGAGATMEVLSEPLVRGAQAKVRLKLYNQGDADMEFVTSENGGPTSKAVVYLKDQDGNILAQAKLNQRADFAGQIINGASYAVARIAPGESFVSSEMTFTVPLTAPYAVSLDAVISSTYYRYGKPDQVIAPGVSLTMPTNISEAAYSALASVAQTFFSGAQPVIITGQAISNATGGPMPFVPVVIGVSVRGFDRFYTVNTDAQGNFSYTFSPGVNEAGVYSVWANHPDVKNRSVQATFTISGLQMSPSTAKVSVLRGGAFDIPLTFKNPGDTPLTGITYSVNAGVGVSGSVVGGPTSIDPGKTVSAKFRVSASSTAPDVSYLTLDVTTAEGPADKLDTTVIMVSAIPIITAIPRSYIDTGVVRGDQRLETLTIKNTGASTLINARIEGPATGWMSLATDRVIGDLPPGESVQVAVIFRPEASLAQNVYNDSMVITSDNHIPYRINLQCTVVTDGVGSAQFDLLSSLNEKVGGASIRIQNAALPEIVYTKTTDSLGTTRFSDIPAGNYMYAVSAPGCRPYSASFEVLPGLTQLVPVGLEVTLVEVDFTVTPITIDDTYDITITQTFRTNVPVPVMVFDPPLMRLPSMAPGQVYNGEFRITNYGLVAAEDFTMSFPPRVGEYSVEMMDIVPDTIGAMQTITVPIRVIRSQ